MPRRLVGGELELLVCACVVQILAGTKGERAHQHEQHQHQPQQHMHPQTPYERPSAASGSGSARVEERPPTPESSSIPEGGPPAAMNREPLALPLLSRQVLRRPGVSGALPCIFMFDFAREQQ